VYGFFCGMCTMGRVSTDFFGLEEGMLPRTKHFIARFFASSLASLRSLHSSFCCKETARQILALLARGSRVFPFLRGKTTTASGGIATTATV
jgi:hypothetical protein